MISVPDPRILDELETRRRADARRAGSDVHLRSSRVVNGYRIEASDDLIGHVADFLFDETTWAIRYLIVESGNWLHGRRVLVFPRWIRAVSWSERTVSLALTRKQIEAEPRVRSGPRPVDRVRESAASPLLTFTPSQVSGRSRTTGKALCAY